MILTTKEYQSKFHPTKSVSTVARMLKSGLTPSNHIIFKAHDYFIHIDNMLPACIEFHKKKCFDVDSRTLATVLSVKYKVDKDLLFKYLGL